MTEIRLVIPYHLCNLAGTGRKLVLDVPDPVTTGVVIDTLEATYPALRGTVRDPATLKRRPFIRFFACEEDLSNDPLDNPLPSAVVTGREALHIVGAMAGG